MRSPAAVGHLFAGLEVGVTLNEVTARYLAGEAGPGSTLTQSGDNGAATLTFEFGQPQPRDKLQAFAAHPEATVIPVTWTLMMNEGGHGRMALVCGDGSRRIVSIMFDPRGPALPTDSGFTLIREGELLPLNADLVQPICLHCLIENHGYVGAGLDLAREHGAAEWDGTRWVAADTAEGEPR